LLQAFSISELRRSHRLIIVGEGERRANLESLIRSLGMEDRVVLAGAMDNPFPVLQGAALLVLSSRWEGYPNVLLEALALNVPVISTDCRHGPRELLDGGRHGSLVPVGDPAALASAMDAGLQPPSYAGDAVLAAHNPHVIASRYLALLDGMQEEGSP